MILNIHEVIFKKHPYYNKRRIPHSSTFTFWDLFLLFVDWKLIPTQTRFSARKSILGLFFRGKIYIQGKGGTIQQQRVNRMKPYKLFFSGGGGSKFLSISPIFKGVVKH